MTQNLSPSDAPSAGRPAVLAVGGPTAVLEVGGLRLVTDPTFDAPGTYGLNVAGFPIVKTDGAALGPGDLGPVDAVLLSHDQHPDNLDKSGREYLRTVPLVLTTPAGAGRLAGSARGLAPWEHHDLRRPDGGTLRVTAVPAQHGPEGSETIQGEVTGFVLTASDLPTVYVTGDNASLDVVRRITDRFAPVDTVILFAGAARPGTFDGALVTLDSEQAAEAARILGARRVVPVHFNSWQHITEGGDTLRGAFAKAGLADRLVVLQPGETTTA